MGLFNRSNYGIDVNGDGKTDLLDDLLYSDIFEEEEREAEEAAEEEEEQRKIKLYSDIDDFDEDDFDEDDFDEDEIDDL